MTNRGSCRARLAAAIGALAALVLAVPVTLTATQTRALAVGPDLLPVAVANNTGRSEAVYLYILGTDIRPGGGLGYVNAAGAFTRWPAGGIPPTPAPDVSIAGPPNGGSVTVRFPRFISGRMYFSFGRKLDFRLTPDGVVQPAPWAAGDPNRDVLFDWSEFTYNDAGLWLNSSQVDQFAVPHAVSVTSGSGVTTKTGELLNDGRNNVINAVKAQPAFARSVVTRADGTVLRVLAPGKAMDAGLMDAAYLDSYLNSAWNAYTSRTLTVVPRTNEPNRRFFGRTVGSTMVFTDSSGAQVATVARPTTGNVWGCDGVFNAPNTPPFIEPEIKRTLCTALNRGTLGQFDTEPRLDAASFYKNSAPNHYSRIIHANMADGKAYGFAYDDVGGFESLVHSGDPRSAAITLTPFGAGGPTGPPPTTPPATGDLVVSNWHQKCVDVPNWNFADGQRLIVWDCHGGTNQRWEFVNGTLRTQNNKCMDVAWGSTANGAAIQIATCSGNPAQQFVLTAAGDLVNPQANKCVDIAGWNPNNDALLQLWECTGGANQKWHRG
ncbi:Ricin-type beta-trefoil lectin domain-containing protein [Micromonospora purpureochromogenes]|uniref:Ricin-type beta-trefoil lectin domain-containing protein n=1 Tax=Micromonospora purpureochromogenes TaxID=47872 RepID=A0A1C4YJY5_9ACTN|nr:beta-1,3-glucanase family protein [Micromonospora purpureochromogenes]SCF21053.1 Ricin-type beta-trefoil lectin domain-containing protein [Micromonospora purpureochromogenes]